MDGVGVARLRSRVVAALLAASASSCTGPSLASQQVAALADRAGGAVWLVDADGCGWDSKGSAFAIDKRHLVTNRHVVANDSSPMLRSRDGEQLTGKVIGSSEHPDLAVIETTRDVPVDLSFSGVSLGSREPLVVLGYPSPEHVFTASPGRVVSFQGTKKEPREAALTNVPIATGNSGGPGLRADATVAGVVTLMRLRTNAAERVAIMYTADAIRPTVQKFLRKPAKVLSTCGLGPDYVPPVPKTFTITSPPPTAEPVTVLPTPERTAKPAATRRPTTTPKARATPEPIPTQAEPSPVDCPDGTVDTRIEQVEATQDPNDRDSWLVRVHGSTANNTTSDATLSGIYVRVDGDPPESFRVDRDDRLAPNQVIFWESSEVVVRSAEQPTKATAFAAWDWSEPEFAGCGHD
jgi:hypothetical protein